MISYRRTRNTDPPQLVEVWNECVTGRGGYPVRTPGVFERLLYSKSYFNNQDILIAVDDETSRIVGSAYFGFGPNEDQSALSKDAYICAVLVRPDYRRKGIGRELLKRAEANLTERGATSVAFGSMWPNNPYLFGLYGGSNSPGVLSGEPDAEPFLKTMGYSPAESRLVFHKKLDQPLTVADARFALLRRRYEVQMLRTATVGSWWQDCQWGLLEPAELRLVDKLTGIPAARAMLWELEGFSWKWSYPSAGIIDVQVRPDLRKQGLAKFLLSQVLRLVQDQFFAIAELQVPADDPGPIALCKSLGFDQIDVGHTWRKLT